MDEAADALAATASVVVADVVTGPVVLGGSVLTRQPVMAERVSQALRARGVGGPVISVRDGTVGAAVLALRRGDVTVDERVFARIRGRWRRSIPSAPATSPEPVPAATAPRRRGRRR